MKPVDLCKSLQELEGVRWREPEPGSSGLVTECRRLRQIPSREFTAGNLQRMIGQGIGLAYLMPLAIERLRADPLMEGDFHPCDLLLSVLRVEVGCWRSQPAWCEQAAAAAAHAIALFPVPEIADQAVTKAVREAHESFRRGSTPA